MMKWVLAEIDVPAEAALSRATGLHPLLSRILVSRGFADPAVVHDFLARDLTSLSDPAIFPDMAKAVDRIRRSVAGGERIVIYGDYDADGVTAAAVLFLALRELGAAVECYIPDRMTEGYGLNADALLKIRESGANLVITVDCGISAVREAQYAKSIGLDLIITDHHEFLVATSGRGAEFPAPGGADREIPDAFAVIHPAILMTGSSVQVRERVGGLTGVGVAFKLAQALLHAPADDERLRPYLALVTLGTVADVGKITGENRVLVKHGLDILTSGSAGLTPGIAALKEAAGVNGRQVTVGMVGFSLAPRVNATGRLENASLAFRLFTTASASEAAELAGMLDSVNRERQSVEEGILAEARKQCRSLDREAIGAIVLESAAWHPGVIGIVASRIADEFYRPTALIAVKDGMGKGSARSIPGFDLYAGLAACSDLLTAFGGHKYAAGFSLPEDKIPLLRERLSAEVLERRGHDDFVRTLTIDSAVTFEDLTFDLMRELERLAPFGQGNPEPRLGAKGLHVVSSRIVGSNHLKFRVRQGHGRALDAIAFNRGKLQGREVREGARLAAVFTPKLNTWNGTTNIELEIKDIKAEHR